MPSLAALPKRKQRYIRNLAKGMDRTNAARKAGYAEMTARKPRTIETEDVKAVMLKLAQRELPPERIATVLRGGIDAETPRVISWGDKLRYLQTAAEWAGYVDKSSSEGSSLHVLALVPKQEQPAPAQAQAINVESSATTAPVPPAATT